MGLAVSDYSDLLHVRFSPDPGHRNPENLEAVVKVVRTVAEWVQTTLRAGDMPEARRGALREVGRHTRRSCTSAAPSFASTTRSQERFATRSSGFLSSLGHETKREGGRKTAPLSATIPRDLQ